MIINILFMHTFYNFLIFEQLKTIISYHYTILVHFWTKNTQVKREQAVYGLYRGI